MGWATHSEAAPLLVPVHLGWPHRGWGPTAAYHPCAPCCSHISSPSQSQGGPQEPRFFSLRTVLKDSPQGPPTANRHQLPTASRCTTVSVVMCLAHVLTVKQRAFP